MGSSTKGSANMAAMSDEAKAKLEAFRTQVKQKAEKMVNEVMPSKVVELTAIIDEEPLFQTEPSNLIESFDWADAVGSSTDATNGANESRKKRKLENDDAADDSTSADSKYPKFANHVPCNKGLQAFHMKVLKPEVRAAIETANAVKVWIQLNIPCIEAGDNFGVEVQQEALEELTRAENNGLTILDQMMKYYCNRAKLTSKVLKYPGVMDYRQSIIELDMKEQLATKLCIMDVRNSYATLHDVVMKNYDKLNQPRRNTRSSGYY